MVGRARTGLATVVLALAFFTPGRYAFAPPPSRLAVLPCTDILATFTKFQPLLAYLERTAGVQVKVAVMPDLTAFEAAVRSGRIDFALQDPHTFEQLAHLFDGRSLLQTRAVDGGTSQSAVVVVRRDGGITDLSGLRGKKVMFGPTTASAKWVAARQLFESRGIAVERETSPVHGGCCEDIAFAVAAASVDAGVICDHFLAEHTARQGELGLEPAQLRVIGRTPPTPTRVLAARTGAPRAVVDAVIGALLQLDRSKPEHARLMASAEIGGFFPTTRDEYLRGMASRATPRQPSAPPPRPAARQQP